MKMLILASLLSHSMAASPVYCPVKEDMNVDEGSPQFQANGWSITGQGRVSSKTSWNLLGGYMEFDMDNTQTNPAINTNFYTSSPHAPNCGVTCYCDIQKNDAFKSCMEMDIIEVNGNCAMQTTVHTFPTDGKPNNPDCDRWGCAAAVNLTAKKFHIKASFGEDGSLTVTKDGVANNKYSPFPSNESHQVVINTMKKFGAVIESSQWFGWVPQGDKCPKGSQSGLAASHYEISNVRVSGTVVQGPEPTQCSDSDSAVVV